MEASCVYRPGGRQQRGRPLEHGALLLQWGLTPYATCVVTGVILAYLILNKKAPFRTSTLLIPIFGENVVKSKWANAFDAWSAFALTAAVAGGLGYGAMQLSTAVDAFAGSSRTW